MRKEICKICNSESKLIFNKTVLGKYPVDYFYCRNCGFLQTEKPHWLEEAYRCAINDLDTGLLQRNIYYSKIATVILSRYFKKDAEFLDYGGGYGIFTRLMRDNGFNFFIYDPNCPNLFAKEFQFNPEINQISLITSWECFEHFENPLVDLEKMLKFPEILCFLPNCFQRIYRIQISGAITDLSTVSTSHFIPKRHSCFSQKNSISSIIPPEICMY